MIYKRCPSCRCRIPEGQRCHCYEHKRKSRTGALPECNELYNTEAWRKLKEQAKARSFGLDPISLIDEGKIEYGQTVHHIYPLESYPNLAKSIDNLIYITERHHRQIHERYRIDMDAEILHIKQVLEEFFNKYK